MDRTAGIYDFGEISKRIEELRKIEEQNKIDVGKVEGVDLNNGTLKSPELGYIYG